MEAPQANAVETENSQSEMLATEDDQLSERVSEKDTNAGKQEMQKESLNDEGSTASGWEEAVKESKVESGQEVKAQDELKINVQDHKDPKDDKQPSKSRWSGKDRWQIHDSLLIHKNSLPFRVAVGVTVVATILIIAGGGALSTRPWLAKSGSASSAYFSTGSVSAGVIR
ncbi:hypothetical protein GUITHDRAFT_142000 [Guillardia theta CCMP2712]|uniref:Uncharacterized protein n=1 Tax=Guillardia theta (strain CCMP2712) TaxID=905079 RepID=L1IZ50_GUITC|nr:hypothetical protein GUITHDRAFT_142000 [Guillardia theta CCMP2712]EKX41521.1 hypothetical protein GUITHDRAFT_142000 [Guillardia theta CCMP2712]|eukprot:XP_005828501.1 hypothetical protein GUITHDRAFT_142000 [Guillardia theta CCMP2712]